MYHSLIIEASGQEFIIPFVEHVLPKGTIRSFDDAASRALAVLISDGACDEGAFIARCRAKSIPYYILRTPEAVVGTGMTGFARRLADAVHRGTFFHFLGNEARVSAVHARDIAQIVKALVDGAADESEQSTFYVCQPEDVRIDELAEAFAARMGNKRVSTLSTRPQHWMGRIVYGKKRYASYTTDRLVDGSLLRQYVKIEWTDVCDYLRNHTYTPEEP